LRSHPGGGVEGTEQSSLKITANASECAGAVIYTVIVPTLVDQAREPDLKPVIEATRGLAKSLDAARKLIFVYESSYSGFDEGMCGLLIEQECGLRRGRD
jgi:UDP-N-acetyl-D-galactosamine dehydrogenase